MTKIDLIIFLRQFICSNHGDFFQSRKPSNPQLQAKVSYKDVAAPVQQNPGSLLCVACGHEWDVPLQAT